MTTPKCVGCPFRRDCQGCPWSGENPTTATVSDARTGAASGRLALLAHARETPASIAVDRGRGPTGLESNVNDRTPKRIQRKRSKGWKMPEGAVYVGRPSKWGNPFQVLPRSCGCWDVEDENGVTYLLEPSRHASFCSDTWSKRFAARDAVDLFAGLYYGDRLARERDMSDVRDALRGKDLACWCPLDQPCHADVLLEIANGGNA